MVLTAHEGLRVLAEQGAPGLRAERLAARLGVTKGSFYHHFDGMVGYQRELLAHFEQEMTARYIDAVEAAGLGDPRSKLEMLMDLVLANDEAPIEVAVRAWATQDRAVEAVQRRTDATRVDYLRGLFRDLGYDGPRAMETARLVYLVLIGAGHIVPPLSAPEIRHLWEQILQDSHRT